MFLNSLLIVTRPPTDYSKSDTVYAKLLDQILVKMCIHLRFSHYKLEAQAQEYSILI